MEATRTKESCKGCRADVFFAPTVKGKVAIFDYAPTETGTYVMLPDGAMQYVGRDEYPGQDRFVSHWATCPDRERFRK